MQLHHNTTAVISLPLALSAATKQLQPFTLLSSCLILTPHGSLGSHMEKCIFIGYPDGYKGWKFYNPTTKKAVIAERADFDERYFLGRKETQPTIKPSSLLENPPSPV